MPLSHLGETDVDAAVTLVAPAVQRRMEQDPHAAVDWILDETSTFGTRVMRFIKRERDREAVRTRVLAKVGIEVVPGGVAILV